MSGDTDAPSYSAAEFTFCKLKIASKVFAAQIFQKPAKVPGEKCDKYISPHDAGKSVLLIFYRIAARCNRGQIKKAEQTNRVLRRVERTSFRRNHDQMSCPFVAKGHQSDIVRGADSRFTLFKVQRQPLLLAVPVT